jgi:hypothetical protein
VLVEQVLELPKRPQRQRVIIRAATPTRTLRLGEEWALVPVRVSNRGARAVVTTGPAAVGLQARIEAVDSPQSSSQGDQPAWSRLVITPLPGVLMPRRCTTVLVPLRVPGVPGRYLVSISAFSNKELSKAHRDWSAKEADGTFHLIVDAAPHLVESRNPAEVVRVVHALLAEAHRFGRLPEGYADVSEGWFAPWKRWLKQKLLGNFQRAYVDVLSRRQAAFNDRVLAALVELADYCAGIQDERARGVNRLAPSARTALNVASSPTRGRDDSLRVDSGAGRTLQ